VGVDRYAIDHVIVAREVRLLILDCVMKNAHAATGVQQAPIVQNLDIRPGKKHHKIRHHYV
jgi:hypothetical protein